MFNFLKGLFEQPQQKKKEPEEVFCNNCCHKYCDECRHENNLQKRRTPRRLFYDSIKSQAELNADNKCPWFEKNIQIYY
jgi:hypothetical protein